MRQLSDALAPLQAKQNWVIWRWRDGRKVPYQALHPHAHASVTNQSHWSSYAHAVAAAPKDGGVGFVLLNSGVGAIDIDDCIDGVIADWAQEILDLMPECYREITVSGRGLRMLGLAEGPRVHRKFNRGTGSVEVWRDAERFTVITGREIGKCRRLPNIDDLIDEFAPPSSLAHTDIGRLHPDRYEARDVLKKYQYRIVSLRDSVAVGWRSDVIWKVGVGLRERGATPSEIACVFLAMTAYTDKHGEGLETLRREVERVFAKSSVKESLRRT